MASSIKKRNSNSLTISSINTNSMQNSLTHIKNIMNTNKIDILFLQETHRIDEQLIKSWGNTNNLHACLNAPNTQEADHHFKSGTACLLTMHSFINIRPSIINIIPNRAQFFTFAHNNESYLLVNLYLPSGNSNDRRKERQDMIEHLDELIDKHPHDHLILIGDFNLVLHHLDTTSRITQTKDFYSLQSIIQHKCLKDSFRILNPKTRTYSYTRNISGSRIDRIYIPTVLQNQIKKSTYIPINFSDHNAAPLITIDFAHPILPARVTMWKLNDSLLLESTNRARLIYLLEKSLEKPTRLVDPLLWWDKFKTQAKYLFQSIGSMDKKKLTTIQHNITQNIKNAPPQQSSFLLQKLKDLELQKERGAFVRSRSKLQELDETPSKAFFQIEQQTQINNTILTLKESPTSPEIKDQSKIKRMITDHYQKIWNQAPPSHSHTHEQYLSDVPEIEDLHLFENESPLITEEEIKASVNRLNPNSSPGSDGLTTKFYSSFLKTLSPILMQVYNNIFIRKDMAPSHKTAIVKLIPKSGSSKLISNWRPISLLNCDYKILANIIASRLKPILSSYISTSQQCALADRHLHNNLLNILSAIDYANDKSHPLAILQLDFSKAFDSLSHSFIIAIMRHTRIPPALIQWTSILLTGISAQINVNHTLTETIPITNGIRQGCPLSMLLFVMATDVFAKKLLSTPTIQGLDLGNASLKLQQYADDTTLFLTSQSEISTALDLTQRFSRHSNLRLNPSKTTILSNSKPLALTTKSLLPEAKSLEESKILGIRFSFTKPLSKQNWKIAVAKMRNIAYQHKKRKLTIFGKLQIIKTLILPHITHMARLFTCPKSTQNTISFILHKLLWSPHMLEPIKRSTLVKIPEHGGIGFPCVQTLTKTAFALKFRTILANPNSDFFWIKYAKYNLSYRIRDSYPIIFANNMPHRPQPNAQWKALLNIINARPLLPEDWMETTHKRLYQHLLQSTPCPLPNINSRHQPQDWTEILLLRKSYQHIPNKQKEITYRVAHSGFLFGHFNATHNIIKLPDGTLRNNSCKFCSAPKDTPSHVFYDCPITREILRHLQTYIEAKSKQPIILTKSLVLFNVAGAIHDCLKPSILKIVSLLRRTIYDEKVQLDTTNTQIQNHTTFITKITDCIIAQMQCFFT